MGKSRNVEDVVRRLLEDPVANANDIIKIQAKITSTTDEVSIRALHVHRGTALAQIVEQALHEACSLGLRVHDLRYN